MIGAIGSFFQVAGQIGQAVRAVQNAFGGDAEDGQDNSAALNAANANAVQRTVELTGADGKRTIVTKITKPDGSTVTRRTELGDGMSFSDMLAAATGNGKSYRADGSANRGQGVNPFGGRLVDLSA